MTKWLKIIAFPAFKNKFHVIFFAILVFWETELFNLLKISWQFSFL